MATSCEKAARPEQDPRFLYHRTGPAVSALGLPDMRLQILQNGLGDLLGINTACLEGSTKPIITISHQIPVPVPFAMTAVGARLLMGLMLDRIEHTLCIALIQ